MNERDTIVKQGEPTRNKGKKIFLLSAVAVVSIGALFFGVRGVVEETRNKADIVTGQLEVVRNKALNNNANEILGEKFILVAGETKEIGDTAITITRCSDSFGRPVVSFENKIEGVTSKSVGNMTFGGVGSRFAQPYGVLLLKSLDIQKCEVEFEYRPPSAKSLPINQLINIEPGDQWVYEGNYILVSDIRNFYASNSSGEKVLSEEWIYLLNQGEKGGGQLFVSNRPFSLGEKTFVFTVLEKDLENHTAKIKITEVN